MPIKFEYEEETNVVNIKVTGILTSDEIVNYFSELLESNVVRKGFIEVVDLNEVEDFILRYSDLEQIKILTAELNEIGQKCSLMCACNDVSQGVSSMMYILYQRADFDYYMVDSFVALKSKLNVFLD